MNTLRLFLILFCCVRISCVYGTPVTENIDTLHKKALSLYGNNQYEAALKLFDKNLILQKSDTTKNVEFWARTHRNAGMCLLKLHQLQKAGEYLTQAIDKYLLIIENEPSSQNYNRLGVCFENRSFTTMHKGEFEKAIYDAQEAIFWFRKADKIVNEIRALIILANIYLDTKNFDTAKEKCFEALKKSRKVKNFSDESLVIIYHTLALIYQTEAKDYNESAKYYTKSIELTKDSIVLAKTLNNLGNVYLENENFPKAKDYFLQPTKISATSK